MYWELFLTWEGHIDTHIPPHTHTHTHTHAHTHTHTDPPPPFAALLTVGVYVCLDVFMFVWQPHKATFIIQNCKWAAIYSVFIIDTVSCVCVCVCVSLPPGTPGTVARGTQGSFDFLLVSTAHSFCTHEICTLGSQCDGQVAACFRQSPFLRGRWRICTR